MAFLDASSVKLLDELRQPLRGPNQKGQDRLQSALGRIGAREKASGGASGRPRSSYIESELGNAGSMASRGIEDQLLSALGGASYDELQKQQEHERSLALAREIGDLTAPSILEQVLSGLGGGARAGGQFYQLYGSLNKPRDPLASVYGNV